MELNYKGYSYNTGEEQTVIGTPKQIVEKLSVLATIEWYYQDQGYGDPYLEMYDLKISGSANEFNVFENSLETEFCKDYGLNYKKILVQ